MAEIMKKYNISGRGSQNGQREGQGRGRVRQGGRGKSFCFSSKAQ